MKPLPATYLEHLAAYDGPLLRAARDHAAELSASDLIRSDSGFEPIIARRIETILAATSKQHCIPVPELCDRLKKGEFDNEVNALRITTSKMYLTAIRHFIAGERIYYCADG